MDEEIKYLDYEGLNIYHNKLLHQRQEDVQSVVDMELTIAAALNDLELRKSNSSDIINELENDERVISESLNNLNERVDNINERVDNIKENVQADWNATEGDAAILNRPDITTFDATILNDNITFITTMSNRDTLVGKGSNYTAFDNDSSHLISRTQDGRNIASSVSTYNDGKITISANAKAYYAAYGDSLTDDKEIAIKGDIPTKVSDLENDVSYVTEDEIKVDKIDANGHDYVEIAGIKWATMNVGATSETDAGLYFQWGDTQGYTADQVGTGSGQKAFSWTDYKWSDNGSSSVLTKYNSTDSKRVLDIEDDAARANWGGNWRMPTTEELQALGNAVNAVLTENYNGSGVNGLLCTDKTDSSKKLFFPAVGIAGSGSIFSIGDVGYVWSNSLNSNTVPYAWFLYFYDEGARWDDSNSRCYGFSVRGVLDTAKVDKYATKEELNTTTNDLQELIEAAKNCINVTYSEIVALRDTNKLISGQWYRITDYVATTAQTDTRSANHPFDVLVQAIDGSHLKEDAYATLHEGDMYFANSKLEAWKLNYCLDNDTKRFGWADTENGKGVIYRMVDEFSNDVCYDFKGILFARYKITAIDGNSGYNSAAIGKYVAISGAEVMPSNAATDGTKNWYYTFSTTLEDNTDCSTYWHTYNNQNIIAHNNYIGHYIDDYKGARLNNIVIVGYNHYVITLNYAPNNNIFHMTYDITIISNNSNANAFHKCGGIFILCEGVGVLRNKFVESSGIAIEGALCDNYFYYSGELKSFNRHRTGSNLDGSPIYSTVRLERNIFINSGGNNINGSLNNNLLRAFGGNNILGYFYDNDMCDVGGNTFNSDVYRSNIKGSSGNLFNLIYDSTISSISGNTLSNINCCTIKNFGGVRFIGNKSNSSKIYTLIACDIIAPLGIAGLTISVAGTSDTIKGVTFDLSKYSYSPLAIVIKSNTSRITTTTGQDIVQLDTLGNIIQ